MIPDSLKCYRRTIACALVLVTSASAMSGADKWPDGDLFGRYRFNEPSGAVAEDVSQFLNHGAIFGTQRVPGIQGGGIRFGGVGDYIGLPDLAAFSTFRYFSFQAWVKPECPMPRKSLEYLAGRGSSWWVRIDSENKVGFGLHVGANKEMRSLAPLKQDEWNHVACTYDGKELRIYINGVPSGSQPATGVWLSTQQRPVVLGTCPWLIGQDSFIGVLDEVQIHSRPLHPTEVAATASKYLKTEKAVAATSSTSLEPDVVVNISKGEAGLRAQPDGASIKVTGGTWGTDESGSFLTLSGDGSSLVYPAPKWPAKSDALTVSFWINLHEVKRSLVGGSFVGIGGRMFARIGYMGTLNFGLSMDGWREMFASKPLTVNEWHHVVVVYDGIYMRLFIDGVADGLYMQSGNLVLEGQPLVLGACSWDTTTGAVNASFRDVRIYHKALTIDQIKRNDPQVEELVGKIAAQEAQRVERAKSDFAKWHAWALGLAGETSQKIIAPPTLSLLQTPAISRQMILPDTSLDSLIGVKTDRFVVVSTPGEVESLSVVLRPNENVKDLSVEISDLVGAGGKIKASHIDPFWVKAWYQDGNAWKQVEKNWEKTIVPELLLKNDSLIQLDDETQDNFIKMERGDRSGYAWISEPRTRDNPNERVGVQSADLFSASDSVVLLPLSLEANKVKQLWLKLTTPPDAKPGSYTAEMTIKSGADVLGRVPLHLVVLPFTLPPATTHYDTNKPFTSGIYYWGQPDISNAHTVGATTKSLSQMSAELKDLRSHGIDSPILIWSTELMYGNIHLFRKALQVWKDAGFSGQPIYFGDSGCLQGPIEEVLENVKKTVALCREMGIPDVYFYGIDEKQGKELLAQKEVWRRVREAGGKIIVSGFAGQFEAVGEVLDVCVWAFEPLKAEAEKWHSLNHRIWSYYNPQAGVEDPEIYRRNYGIVLWSRDFDGMATYDYMDLYIAAWNDFDHSYYRKHGFVLPTATGFVPTIAWCGYREAIDDIKYLTAVRSKMAELKNDSSPDAKAWSAKAAAFLAESTNNAEKVDLDEMRREAISLLLVRNDRS